MTWSPKRSGVGGRAAESHSPNRSRRTPTRARINAYGAGGHAPEVLTLGPLDIRAVMACIPHRYPMLLVDRVEALVLNTSIVGIKAVTINEGFFDGHFPGRPIMPGVLIIEALAQAAAILGIKSLGLEGTGKLAYFMGIENARFRSPVEPGCLLRLEVKMTHVRGRICKFSGRAMVDDRLATEADFTAMVADPPA